MTAKLRGLLCVVFILLSVVAALAQRGQQPGAQPVFDRGPGTVNSPGGGYVSKPDTPPAGELDAPKIPGDDPVEISYWDLYDANRSITLTGKVTRVTWVSPNVYIFMEANNVSWAVEASFAQFKQAAVTPAVRAGQTISVSGYLPKETSPAPGRSSSRGASRTAPNPVLLQKIPSSAVSYANGKHLVRASEIKTEYGQKLKMGRPRTAEEEAELRRKCNNLGC
jgi:hypothetical protein